jgi:ubiquinone/menaquinone biosynthesis C-methylase UbiE
MADHSEDVEKNRQFWDLKAKDYVKSGEQRWAEEPSWGIWDVPDKVLGVLPQDARGLDTLELGCGTGYVSAWLARRGARPVGIDNSPEQLATARRLQARHGMAFPLHLGNAEALPFADASFDLAISEYGASIWCDPYRWIPEASRVLRPGGQLVFLCNSVVMTLAVQDDDNEPATERMQRPQRGMHRFVWSEPSGVEFHISHGDWIRLLRRSGFEIEDLIEVYPVDGAKTEHRFVSLAWARSWPCEEIWKARKWM